MKKIFLFLTFVVMSIGTQAHTPLQKCSSSGWFTYIWSALGHSTSVEITWGKGHHGTNHGKGYDTIIYNLNLRPITTFQAPVGQDVTFEFNDGYETHFVVHLPPCGNLPVILTAYKATVLGPSLYNVSWTTEMESNNDHFTIQASPDTGSWKTVANIKSFYSNGNGNTPHDYNITVSAESNNIIEAGIGKKILLFYAISFVFFLIVGRIKSGRWFTSVLAITIMFFSTSCSKTNLKTPDLKTYKYFRIVQVDKDGGSVNSPVMVVNN